MLDEIKAHWYQIKKEYEYKYNEPFLRDFKKSKEYLNKMKNYLFARHKEYPSNVDLVCTLASVKLELRGSDTDYVNFLERFLNRFEDSLDDKQKARIYTNIAFVEDYSKRALKYLNRAYEIKSPFAETYTGLGLYYFGKYESYKAKKDLLLSKKYFKIAKDMDKSYQYSLNYAVCLYELKEYENAKKIFIKLLAKYPNRNWLMLCIAYCEVNLGNKKSAISYLEQVKVGQDENYSLNTDDISDYQIFDVYYVIEEYDTFLTCWNKEAVSEYYIADWEHYFYVLWIKNERKLFCKYEEMNTTYFEDAIKEAATDEDYESEEERQETIISWEKDKREFEEMIARIKVGTSNPTIKLKLYPEFSCFMVDCVRHKF